MRWFLALACHLLLSIWGTSAQGSELEQLEQLQKFDRWITSAFLSGKVTESDILNLGDSVTVEEVGFEPPGHAVGDWTANKYLLL